MMGGPQYLLLAVGTFLLASKCLDADFSTISSPGYPRTYPPKGETIRHGVKSGSRMKLTIKKMSLSDGDTVTIYNGYYCSTWRVGHFVLKTYTASNANVDDVLFSNGNKVCVELKAPKGGGSFYIEVEDFPKCNGLCTGNTGVIASPSYPNDNYPYNEDCRWHVAVSPGQRIQYRFRDFNLATKDPCDAYLELTNVQAGKLCKADVSTKTFQTNGTESDVIFHSPYAFFGGYSNYRGFWLVYTALGCKASELASNSDRIGNLINPANYYQEGYIAKFTCLAGHKYPGDENKNRFICRDRNWFGDNKDCIEIRCGNPETPADGSFVLSNDDKIDSVANYTCHDGFTLVGDGELHCLQTGKWSGEAPECAGVHTECSVPGAAPNRKVIGTNHSIGDSISYTCNEGYQLKGSKKITCLDGGKWDASFPTCEEISCPADLSAPVNGSLIMTKNNNTAVFNCSSGYRVVGENVIKCLKFGNWSSAEPSCELIQCPIIHQPADGSMLISGQAPGSHVNFSCNARYTLIGPSSAICMESGKWSFPDTPFCLAIRCPRPRNVTNAKPISSAHYYLDVVTYQCDPDYFIDSDWLVSEVNITCQANGTWNTNFTGCLFSPESTNSTLGPVPTTQVVNTTFNTTGNPSSTLGPVPTQIFNTSDFSNTTENAVFPTGNANTKVSPSGTTAPTLRPVEDTTATATVDAGGIGPGVHTKQSAGGQDKYTNVYIGVAVVVVALIVAIALYAVYRRRRLLRSSSAQSLTDAPSNRFDNPLYSNTGGDIPSSIPGSKAWADNRTYNDADDVMGDGGTDGGYNQGGEDIYDRPPDVAVRVNNEANLNN